MDGFLSVRRGYECCIIMPDDVAIEKVNILQTLGAEVVRVRPGERQMIVLGFLFSSYIDP